MPGTPTRLGRYVVRRRLGSGAFATVWLAYDEHLDCPVAVKVLADNWAGDPEVHRRFLEEGRFLRRVESPHVVGVYDAGELPDGRPYLVMAFADQGTLADRTSGGAAPFTAGQAVAVLRDVGAGLQALHDRGVLHRDVKPANVLFRTVDAPGEPLVRAMLGDLGLGRALDASSRLTVVAGTPSYVAPEQARAETPDARADQYSLGALAYLLLGGRPPFAFSALSQARDPEPPAPLPGHAPAVDAVVRRALAVERDERWPDVRAFVAALDDALTVPDGGGATHPWLPLDPEVTQAGAGPTALPEGGSVPSAGERAASGGRAASASERAASGGRAASAGERASRPRRTLAAATLVLGTLAAVAAGYAAHAAGSSEPQAAVLTDDSGTLAVEVPAGWDRAVGTEGWTAPQDDAAYPALSAGTTEDWSAGTDPAGHGVFVALMPGVGLPDRMPGHQECTTTQAPYSEDGDQPSRTVVHTGCPGGVVVERVVEVAADRLLWVQVRSPDTATANRVLDGVRTFGI